MCDVQQLFFSHRSDSTNLESSLPIAELLQTMDFNALKELGYIFRIYVMIGRVDENAVQKAIRARTRDEHGYVHSNTIMFIFHSSHCL